MKDIAWYSNMAKLASKISGRPVTFAVAVGFIIVWGITGPIFGFSDTWQLVINTATTIVTFLMVFLIQNTQNRDTEAIQIKLDELIRATQGAHNALLDLEEMEESQLDEFHDHYEKLAHEARLGLKKGHLDTSTSEAKQTATDKRIH
jgi:low affinity Fe/Cu permease